MKPYTPNTDIGRTIGGHDIHHKSADQSREAAKTVAKAARHAARQEGRRQADSECVEADDDVEGNSDTHAL
jgi:hypothetical protein